MKTNILFRTLLDLLIFTAIFHALWFIALPLAIFGSWKYPHFTEIILAGVIYDSLFGFVPEMGVAGYVGTIVAVGAFLLVVILKRVVRRV